MEEQNVAIFVESGTQILAEFVILRMPEREMLLPSLMVSWPAQAILNNL